MTGVGFSRHPDHESSEETEIHLWRASGRNHSETYCSEFNIEISLSNKGMTQVTSSQIEQWEENPQVCDNCVEKLDDQYN